MCRFNPQKDRRTTAKKRVSIHRMCRFNVIELCNDLGLKVVSIHRMCRFNINIAILNAVDAKFQYIVCVGSIDALQVQRKRMPRFQYIVCVGSIYRQ